MSSKWYDKQLDEIPKLKGLELDWYNVLYKQYSDQSKLKANAWYETDENKEYWNKYYAIKHILDQRKFGGLPAPDLTIPEFLDKVSKIKTPAPYIKKTIFNDFKNKIKQVAELFKLPNIHLSPIEFMSCYDVIYKLPFGIYIFTLKQEYCGDSNCDYVLGKTYRTRAIGLGLEIKYFHQVKIVELY